MKTKNNAIPKQKQTNGKDLGWKWAFKSPLLRLKCPIDLSKDIFPQISSFKATLKQVKEDLESQTHRADSLQSRCKTMQERVKDLENEIINKTNEKVERKREFTDTTCQTEDSFYEVGTSVCFMLTKTTNTIKGL